MHEIWDFGTLGYKTFCVWVLGCTICELFSVWHGIFGLLGSRARDLGILMYKGARFVSGCEAPECKILGKSALTCKVAAQVSIYI